MATSFRRPIPVIQRTVGYFNDRDGSYVPAVEPDPVMIMGTTWPARASDYDRMEALQDGRKMNELRLMNCDTRLNTVKQGGVGEGHPGDVVLEDGARFLVIHERRHTILQSSVSHYRYILEREISKAPGENPL